MCVISFGECMYNIERTAKTELPGQDSQDETARKEQLGRDKKQPGQDRQEGHEDGTARKG
jgi:hypothetical protein